MTSRTGHGHAPPHAQGSWVRDYESVDYDVPLLDPQARADSDDETEGEETERLTSMSTTQQPPPTPPKDTPRSPKRSSSNHAPSSPSKMSLSSSASSSSSSAKSSPPTPPKRPPRAAPHNANASKPDAPITITDDQRLAMPARAYGSADNALDTRGAAVGSKSASASAPVPSTASGSSGSLPRSVSNAGSASSGPIPEQGGATRGAPLVGSSRAMGAGGSGTAPSSAGMTATSTQRMSYGSGDPARSGNFGSIEALVGQNQFSAGLEIQLQNISPSLSPDFSLSFSPSSSSPPSSVPLSSSGSSPAFFTPPTTSSPPSAQTQAQLQTRRSPPAVPHPRPSSLTAAYRPSPLAQSQVSANAMSASNSPSKKGDYIAVPPSSPGPAELTHALSPPTAVSGLPPPHPSSGPVPSSSSTISGLPSIASSTTVVAPHTPGMIPSTSSSTVPTLASTLSPSPPTGYAAPLARPAGGSLKAGIPPYPPMPAQMQRVPSDGPDSRQTSRRPSADSSSMLKDHGYIPPPAFTHHAYPQPGSGAIPRPALHSSASRGSMILYRLSATEDGILPPHPGINHAMNRSSVYSNSGDSIASLGQDSKYPLVGLGINHTGGSGMSTPPRMNTGGSGFSTNSVGGRPPMPLHPGIPGVHQGSIGSRGGSSLMFSEIGRSQGGLVAYSYDPDEDIDADELDEEEEEWIRMVGGRVVGGYFHSKDGSTIGQPEKSSGKATPSTVSQDPRTSAAADVTRSSTLKKKQVHATTIPYKPTSMRSRGDFPWRGVMNISTIVILVSAMLCLFVVYPVTQVYTNNGVDAKILGNTRINATGQAVGDFADVNGNNSTLAAGAAAGAGAAVASNSGKGKGGVDKMDVGRREALEQLEADARRRMERWDGLARVRGEQ